jgi:hypothetical protein
VAAAAPTASLSPLRTTWWWWWWAWRKPRVFYFFSVIRRTGYIIGGLFVVLLIFEIVFFLYLFSPLSNTKFGCIIIIGRASVRRCGRAPIQRYPQVMV